MGCCLDAKLVVGFPYLAPKRKGCFPDVGFQRSHRQPEPPEPKELLEPRPQEQLVLPEQQGPGC